MVEWGNMPLWAFFVGHQRIILTGVSPITYTCLRYLFLAPKSSYLALPPFKIREPASYGENCLVSNQRNKAQNGPGAKFLECSLQKYLYRLKDGQEQKNDDLFCCVMSRDESPAAHVEHIDNMITMISDNGGVLYDNIYHELWCAFHS